MASECKLKICSCNKTMPLDAAVLARGLQLDSPPRIHGNLCRREIGEFEAAAGSGHRVVVACTQEAALFDEVASAVASDSELSYVNVRETAGWSGESHQSSPKVAALLAAAMLPDPEPVPGVSYSSGGHLLIIGQGAAALGWADRLAAQLDVAVLVTSSSGRADLPFERKYPVYSGVAPRVDGYLGAFKVSWDQSNPIDLNLCTRCNACIEACPEQAIDYSYQIDLDRCKSHRKCVSACGDIRAIDFDRAERSRSDSFDLILDLSDTPLIRLHQPPQGYFTPGRDPLDQALAVQQLAQMVGEFEKPRFFVYRENICAHGRSRITGCSQCLEVCSTSAISEDGDHVRVEPHLCMGCGGCATVCPSGALGYAYPRVGEMGTRLRTLLQAYLRAGGESACLLFHDPVQGRALISELGRRGKGLPARVIPVETFHIASTGLDLMLGSLALGAAQVAVLATGKEAPEYLAALRRQMGHGQAIMSGLGYPGEHLLLAEAEDFRQLERWVWGLPAAGGCKPATFNLFNEKRTTLEFVFDHLARQAPAPKAELALAAGAPYGTIRVDQGKCTLCLACVGACPEKALLDGKERPMLKFIEANCVQCGLCANTCPEDAITLMPRLLLGKEAKLERMLNEAEPYLCVRCGKPFATRQIIDSMLGKLGSHSMFAEAGSLERLKMCAECRVIDLMEHEKRVSIFEEGR